MNTRNVLLKYKSSSLYNSKTNKFRTIDSSLSTFSTSHGLSSHNLVLSPKTLDSVTKTFLNKRGRSSIRDKNIQIDQLFEKGSMKEFHSSHSKSNSIYYLSTMRSSSLNTNFNKIMRNNSSKVRNKIQQFSREISGDIRKNSHPLYQNNTIPSKELHVILYTSPMKYRRGLITGKTIKSEIENHFCYSPHHSANMSLREIKGSYWKTPQWTEISSELTMPFKGVSFDY